MKNLVIPIMDRDLEKISEFRELLSKVDGMNDGEVMRACEVLGELRIHLTDVLVTGARFGEVYEKL